MIPRVGFHAAAAVDQPWIEARIATAAAFAFLNLGLGLAVLALAFLALYAAVMARRQPA